MSAAAARAGIALAAVLAIAGCDFGGPGPIPSTLYEGTPPLAVVGPPVTRPGPRLSPEESRALGPAAALTPLFAALEALDNRTAATPVVIMQLGDSHSASDFLSGRMRELFQRRFGAAGRGMLPPGMAYPYFRPNLVKVGESDGWRRASSRASSGPFGLGGVIQQAQEGEASATLTATEDAGFDRAFFEVLRQPGAGAVRMQVDRGTVHEFATAAGSIESHWIEFNTPPRSRTISLGTGGDRPVTVLSWGTQRQVPGIVYENLGIVGATVDIVGHWDVATVAAELGRRAPALIVVAYGTNEGVAPASTLTGYAERFASRVRRLGAASPQAAILVVGPPDVNRRAGDGVSCGAWSVPPSLDTVREAQRQAAARDGWYFWDWQAAMGGPCAIDRWTQATPPLAHPDHVHLRREGYAISADLLFAELMKGYERYRARAARVSKAATAPDRAS